MQAVDQMLGLPTPVSISIWWNAGSILGFLLMFQIVSGLFLSMHYCSDVSAAFNSMVHIMRDVDGGWMIRSMHANGASMFFLMIYVHMGRGLYYQSYLTQPRSWMVGVSIFLVSMATAFLGYVLPWGQMSFWGATVITNLLSAVPYFGVDMVQWVWGGFSVGGPTLNRFFSLHFILPFFIAGLAALHIIFLHEKGSTNPLGETNHISKVSFHPYFTWKDIVGILVLLIFLCLVVMFFPSLLTDPENYSIANPMVTPTHIQPEWYFLFAYAILRSIPSKLGGVIALGLSVLALYVFPVASIKRSLPTPFSFLSQFLFWCLVSVFFMLTWLGSCPIEEPYLSISKPVTAIYFLLFPLMISSGWVSLKIITHYIK
uniref:Cytochrome b n=1 Tax=Lissachatina fulica TaxID=2315439 RepID=A0A097J9J0_LISFU|nr:cytochrome b [Lissachatina fulica]